MLVRKEDFARKTVLVMGLGRFGGGVDAAEFAVRAGAKVIVTDLANRQQLSVSMEKLKKFPHVEFHLGSHEPADFEKADIVIANPAVPGKNRFLEIARRANRLVTSQINIFFELCPAKIIGITGANGKSTTTALAAHLLRSQNSEGHPQAPLEAATHPSHESRVTSYDVIASESEQSQTTQYTPSSTQYKKVWLSGNIGNQPLLTILDKIQPDDLVILELSSFQIEQLAEIQKAPNIALLTNLTPNHLDRYGTFENYCAAKENIFKYQKLDENRPAVSIFNTQDKIASEWFEKYKKDSGRICIVFSADNVSDDIRNCYKLPGGANLSNLAAALAIARHFGVSDESIKKSLPEFKALPHRLELVKETNGVRWYNDSKATTPEGAITALDAFEQPIILIAGGYDKNLPFDKLGEKIAQKAKAAILIGQTAPKIRSSIPDSRYSMENRRASSIQHLESRIQIVNSLNDAVTLANKIAKAGDIILLSPACASYDMFENYEQRGQQFKNLVRSLEK